MYLRSLHIANVKLLRDVTLDFRRGDAPRMWTVLLGENGLCKTTILQAIALAASGHVNANKLADVQALPDFRSLQQSPKIQALFQAPLSHGARFVASQLEGSAGSTALTGFGYDTHDEPAESNYEKYFENANRKEYERIRAEFHGSASSQTSSLRLVRAEFDQATDEWIDVMARLDSAGTALTRTRSQNVPGWLVAGYGVSRVLPVPRTSPAPNDPALDRLAPLFSARPIVSTDFIDYLGQHSPKLALDYARTLDEALLRNRSVLPDVTRFERRGKGGVARSEVLTQSHRFSFRCGGRSIKIPATWLSQGYQATIAWIADLIGQAFWDAKKAVALDEIRGIALIDELDLHLHPRWQRGFITALKALFPKVQFIVTTHSPMLLPGLEPDEIVRLERDDSGSVVVGSRRPAPDTMTAAQLYESFFDLSTGGSGEWHERLMRYGLLVGDPGRSDEEDLELHGLRAQLAAAGRDPGWEPVPRTKSGEVGA